MSILIDPPSTSASRFKGLHRCVAWFILAVFLLIIATDLLLPPPPSVRPLHPQHQHLQHAQRPRFDDDLYAAIAARVTAGQNYYSAVAIEHRTRGYPLRPFFTVRPPLLAEATGLFGGLKVMQRVLFVTVLAVLLVAIARLRVVVQQPAERIGAIVIITFGLITLADPRVAVWHEVWAGLFVTLALFIYSPQRWWPSVIAGLIAALFRELAIPFLLVMLVVALWERRWREAGAWALALCISGVALAIHAHHVAEIALPTDRASEGWAMGGGWPYVLSMFYWLSLFTLVPRLVAAVLVPLALLGWIGWRTPAGTRSTLWILGMMAGFMIFGRPNNLYWALLITPIVPLGLAFAPRALVDLVKAARG